MSCIFKVVSKSFFFHDLTTAVKGLLWIEELDKVPQLDKLDKVPQLKKGLLLQSSGRKELSETSN